MKTFTALLAAAGLVAGHGYVDNATIGGQFYQVLYRFTQGPLATTL
jgi:hypothetical protein